MDGRLSGLRLTRRAWNRAPRARFDLLTDMRWLAEIHYAIREIRLVPKAIMEVRLEPLAAGSSPRWLSLSHEGRHLRHVRAEEVSRGLNLGARIASFISRPRALPYAVRQNPRSCVEGATTRPHPTGAQHGIR